MSQSLQGYLPGWEFNSKRIALVADAAMIVERSNQSVRCLKAVLFFFRLAAGRVPTATPLQKNQLGMLRSTCRAAAASCNFPGTYSVIGRKVTEKSCTESFFDRFSV
ncbi:hypothetical protein, partial [Pseudomonas aeruginosa]|uniref:hypothetical protein n=1 Tax=Pseudomonas aeruginosa TaxID=287 RepID=UPI00287FE3E8